MWTTTHATPLPGTHPNNPSMPNEELVRTEHESKADALAFAVKTSADAGTVGGAVGIYRNGSMRGTANNGNLNLFGN